LKKGRASLTAALCDPIPLTAKVMSPAFIDHPEGELLSGYCLAKKDGYWLVYVPDDDRFYCFWGTDPSHLGAHGVVGSPLACWLA
jgi:hypothetical protein